MGEIISQHKVLLELRSAIVLHILSIYLSGIKKSLHSTKMHRSRVWKYPTSWECSEIFMREMHICYRPQLSIMPPPQWLWASFSEWLWTLLGQRLRITGLTYSSSRQRVLCLFSDLCVLLNFNSKNALTFDKVRENFWDRHILSKVIPNKREFAWRRQFKDLLGFFWRVTVAERLRILTLVYRS